VWFTDSPAQESRRFFTEEYPPMMHERDAEALIRDAGYSVLGSFRIPDSAWWDDYYTPLLQRLDTLEQQYRDNGDVQALIGSIRKEIRIFRTHSQEYGYSFFVARMTGE
jgi:hypothetical protein